MTAVELTDALKEQFPVNATKWDVNNMRAWIIKENIDSDKLYDVIQDNYSPKVRYFPPLAEVKKWHFNSALSRVRGANNIFNEIMDIGMAMTTRMIYNKIKIIRKKEVWHHREEIFVGLFGGIWGEWGQLKDAGWNDGQCEGYLEKMDAKGKVLVCEEVRVPDSLFDDKDNSEYHRQNEGELKPVRELL